MCQLSLFHSCLFILLSYYNSPDVAMDVPQSLENPCTDLDQTCTEYSPRPPNYYRGVGVKVKGHLGVKGHFGVKS